MPEGPEVRRYADQLAGVLCGQKLVRVDARTKAAKAWLAEHPSTLIGRKVESVRSRGKNLVGTIEGGYYFYSHLMMWGRWQIEARDEEIPRDRRERARLWEKASHSRKSST
jgi:endonuclease VIII